MAKKGLPKRNKRPKKNGRVGAVSWSLRGFLVASSDVGSGIVKVGDVGKAYWSDQRRSL